MKQKRHPYPRRSSGRFNKSSRMSHRISKIKPAADAELKKVFAHSFQLEAISAVNTSDCLVTVPTGAGKTWIAEQAILRMRQKGKRAWYASPLKALSNSKYAEFSEAFGPENVGILTGDRKENPDAPIIVGTTEILRNQLYDAMHQGVSLSTDFVVLDEAHFLGDPDRGVVWEETLIYLPSRIPILMLSATIGNAAQIADWLSTIRKRTCVVVEEKTRPVPLSPLFFHPSGTLYPLLSHNPSRKQKNTRLNKKVVDYVTHKHPLVLAPPNKLPPFGQILRVLRKFRLLPALFFLKSRSDCDTALSLCSSNRIQDVERKEKLAQRIETLVSQSPYVSRHRQRWQLENLAVGAHHSGQLPSWKLLLETLMTEGLLDAVFATSTVAAGVNFPARTVVFLNSDRFNGVEFSPLTPTEFHQMTGRAGRRGMDRIGFALAVPGKFLDTRLVAKLIGAEPIPVLSQIRINFSMVLLMIKGRKKHPLPEQGGNGLWNEFLRHLQFLQAKGFAGETADLTEDGRWASRLRIDQPLLVAEGLRSGIFPDSDPAMLAAMVAAFVSDREFDDRLGKKLTPKALLKAFLKVRRGLRPFAKDMTTAGFEIRSLFLRPAAAIFAWAGGMPWDEVHSIYEMEEGDLAMLILRTADSLRHIHALSEVFPRISMTAAEAIEIILRDPVITEYA